MSPLSIKQNINFYLKHYSLNNLKEKWTSSANLYKKKLNLHLSCMINKQNAF